MAAAKAKARRLKRTRRKRVPLLLLAVCAAVALALALHFRPTHTHPSDENLPIGDLYVAMEAPYCGQDPTEALPTVTLGPGEWATLATPVTWTSSADASNPTPLEGNFVGGEQYTCLLTLTAQPGYSFGKDSSILVYDEDEHTYTKTEPQQQSSSSVTVAVTVTAQHDWDEEESWRKVATCSEEGAIHLVCKADPSHVEETVIEPSPDAHEWGDWKVTKQQTRTEEGEMQRICTLCNEVQTQTIPKVLYTSVYEPDTSWSMAATVAWRADQSAMDVAASRVRPATAFVWLDENLAVYDRDGSLIASDLESYASETSQTVIPALYIRDEATAVALKEWLKQEKLLDCFVVSTPNNQKLVASVADLLHVRGMLDYTEVTSPSREDLLAMVASTNAAHGKVILLASEAATYDNVRLLQKLGSTVWVQTPTDTQTLLTHYTNGVNGVVVDDYREALDAEELFDDEDPTLLRTPFIISHRGDPSVYVENTLDSALGAYVEGADGVENDIHLSSDGELFIYHDDDATGIMGITDKDENGDPIPLESMTLDEIRSHTFPWDSILESNRVSQSWWRYDTLYGQTEGKKYVVPTLREYIEVFQGTPLIHVTEIKSTNPEILPHYKALVDEYDAWDQFISITFNKDILEAAYQNYPELSIGALATEDEGDPRLGSISYAELAKSEGTEAALQQLMSRLDQWNATYNPTRKGYGASVVLAGRHRGLTVWPWTYSLGSAEDFAGDYLSGVTAITGDHSWATSQIVVRIGAQDVTVDALSDVPAPQATTQAGEHLWLDDAELVELERPADDQVLAMWRYKAELVLDETSYGNYYLYSNPFVVTLNDQSAVTHTHDWSDWEVSEPATETAEGMERRECSICQEAQERSIPMLAPDESETDAPADPKVPTTTFIDRPTGDETPEQEAGDARTDDTGTKVTARRSDIVVIAAIAAALVFLVLASRVRPKGRHTRERRAESRDARDSQQSKSGARLSTRTKGTPRGRHAKQ